MTRQEPIDVVRQRVVLAMHELAVDLAKEKRRRVVLERQVRELRTQVAEFKIREMLRNATQPEPD
jgi:hypothetical protein